ncbi:hypothetical protein MMC07_005811 [Pseudocyphellaria aurata]|nr:hypothetical protein [Pseudocyphellaria aurata]
MKLIFSLLALSSVVAAARLFEWNCRNSLGTCNNACFAVNCKGAPSTLTYDKNTAPRSGRRTASGCKRTPCSNTRYGRFGHSCDEFPYASVKQGGKGAILRCVDGTDNSMISYKGEGGQLSNFYRRLNDGEKFKLFVRNYIGAPYCEHAQRCRNDGGEFKLSNRRQFINAKNRRDENVQFVDEEDNEAGKSPFRRFMGDDGLERLFISNDRNETMVGEEIWGENDSTVVITHEIF